MNECMKYLTLFFPVSAAAPENPREKHTSGKELDTAASGSPENQQLLEVCV